MGDFYVYHGIRLLGLMNDGKKSRRDHFAAGKGHWQSAPVYPGTLTGAR